MAENENQSFWKRNWDWVSDGFADAAKEAGKTFVQVSEGTGQLATGSVKWLATGDSAEARSATNKLEPGLKDAQEKAFKTTEFITGGLVPVRPVAQSTERLSAGTWGVTDKSGGAHTVKEFGGQWINSTIINQADFWRKISGERPSDHLDMTKAHKMERVKEHIDIMLKSYPDGKVTVEQFHQAFKKYVDEHMKHGDIIVATDGTVLTPEEFLKKTQIQGISADALLAWSKQQQEFKDAKAASPDMMQAYRDKHPERNIVLLDKQGFIARDEAVELGAKQPERDDTNMLFIIGGGVLTVLSIFSSWMLAIPGIALVGYALMQSAKEEKPKDTKSTSGGMQPPETPSNSTHFPNPANGREVLGALPPPARMPEPETRERGGR